MSALRRGLFVFMLPLSAAAAAAQPPQVAVDAGPNQTLPHPRRITRLEGQVTNVTPLDFWIADGDHATENYLLKYDDRTGLTAVGPLQTSSQQIYGWPSDLEKVGGVVYGIDTFHRKLYRLDAGTGICTPVGSAVSYTALFALAYDHAGDRLYSVDQKTRKLLRFDRSTGKATVILTLPAAHSDVRGLAFRKRDRKLYYCDDATEALYRVDPATGVNEFVLALGDGPTAKVDELDFFQGRLFGSYRAFDAAAGIWSMQLLEIDVENVEARLHGPVIRDCSAHSLVVNSLPETIRWVQIAGPADARIVRPDDVATPVHFPAPGAYVLELQAIGGSTTTRDQVVIRVAPPTSGNPSGGSSHGGPRTQR